MAINRLIDREPLDGAAIDRFLERHGAPIVEDDRATFLWRGEADQVMVRHRVIGWTDPLPLRRIHGTSVEASMVGGLEEHFDGRRGPGAQMCREPGGGDEDEVRLI